MDKNSHLSQELEECKTQLRAALAKTEESKKASPDNTCLSQRESKHVHQLIFGMLLEI